MGEDHIDAQALTSIAVRFDRIDGEFAELRGMIVNLDARMKKATEPIRPGTGENLWFGGLKVGREIKLMAGAVVAVLALAGAWLRSDFSSVKSDVHALNEFRLMGKRATASDLDRMRDELVGILAEQGSLTADGLVCVRGRFGERVAGLDTGQPLVEPDKQTEDGIRECYRQLGQIISDLRTLK